jgi:hypothetical protein
MWRIPGFYCHECMVLVGKDFDDHGSLTLPSKTCDLCNGQFLFLKSRFHAKTQKHFCNVCDEVIASGGIKETESGVKHGRIPPSLYVIGGLGIVMMIMGMIFTMVSSNGQLNLVNLLFGSTTTAIGFILIRRTLKNKRLLVNQLK